MNNKRKMKKKKKRKEMGATHGKATGSKDLGSLIPWSTITALDRFYY
jgi:hypothetical protein